MLISCFAVVVLYSKEVLEHGAILIALRTFKTLNCIAVLFLRYMSIDWVCASDWLSCNFFEEIALIQYRYFINLSARLEYP